MRILSLPLFLLVFCLYANASPREVTKVGVILPLSGEFSAWGQSIQRTLTLIAPEFTDKLVFEFEDEGNCEPAKAVSAFQKLSSSGANFFFVGCFAGTKAILPVANKHDVLLLSVGLLDDEVFTRTTKLINLATQLSVESRYLASHVLSRGVKRAVIFHWEDPFSNQFAGTLKDGLASGGVTTTSTHAIQASLNDFRSLLLRVKRENIDAICANVGEQQHPIFLRQIRQSGIEAPVFTNYPFEVQPTLIAAGKYAEGVEYTYPLNSAEGTVEKAKFDAAFAEAYGASEKPNPNSYFARDGVILITDAFEKCPSRAPDCVSQLIKATRNFEGLSGEVSFNPDGSNLRPYGIKKVVDGKFVWINKNVKLD